jgi:hypothetical protein
MKPITSSSVTTVVPTMPAPLCGSPNDGAAVVEAVVVVATGCPSANAVAAVRVVAGEDTGAAAAPVVATVASLMLAAGVSAVPGADVADAAASDAGGNGSTRATPLVAASGQVCAATDTSLEIGEGFIAAA